MDWIENLKNFEHEDDGVKYDYGNFPWNKGKAGTYTNGPHSEDTKQKISESLKGNVPWNKGKKTGSLPDDTKLKMSEAHKGQAPWNKGIKTPEEIAERKKAYRKAYYARTKK